MELNISDWYESSAYEQPKSVDTESSQFVVFVRKNFEPEEVLDSEGNVIEGVLKWNYLEKKVPKEDWELYEQIFKTELNVDAIRSDIDYLLIMSGDDGVII